MYPHRQIQHFIPLLLVCANSGPRHKRGEGVGIRRTLRSMQLVYIPLIPCGVLRSPMHRSPSVFCYYDRYPHRFLGPLNPRPQKKWPHDWHGCMIGKPDIPFRVQTLPTLLNGSYPVVIPSFAAHQGAGRVEPSHLLLPLDKI